MLTHISKTTLRLRNQVFKTFKRHKHEGESGLTLIEILIAVVIATIFAGVAFLAVNLSSSKGKALYDAMASVANAAETFNVDLGTYPTVYGAMVDTNYLTDNTTGADLTSTWDGPYAKDKNVGPNGNLHLNNIASGVTITFQPLTNTSPGLTTGLPYQYAVVANNVPNAIATQAVNTCNGEANNTKGKNGGQCTLSPGTGQTSTVYYIFAQTQYGAY